MREKIRDKVRLEHIVDSIDRVNSFVSGMDKESFIKDVKTYYATVKNIEMIGEAAYMLTDELKSQHKDIPWQKIKGMRNVLVHEYFNVSPEQVWMTINNDLPKLKTQISNILSSIQ